MLAPCLLALALIPTADPKPRLDPDGIPLPTEAVRRFGSARFCTDPPRSVAFSPDGKTAYLVPADLGFIPVDHPAAVTAWEMPSGRPLWRFADHPLVGLTVAADPSGKAVWLAGLDDRPDRFKVFDRQFVRVKLDAATGKELARVKLSRGWSAAHDLKPDGTLAWNRLDEKTDDLTLRIIKPDGTEQATWDWDEPCGIDVVKFAPDGKTLFVAGPLDVPFRSKLAAVDPATGKTRWVVNTPQIDTLAVSPDGKSLAATTASSRLPLAKTDKEYWNEQERVYVARFDAATGESKISLLVAERNRLRFRQDEPFLGRPISWTADGGAVLVKSDDRTTLTIDPVEWTKGEVRKDNAVGAWFTPDGKSYLPVAERYQKVRVYEAATHQPLAGVPEPLPRSTWWEGADLTISSDGTRLQFGTTAEFDLTTGKQLPLEPWEKRKLEPVTGVAEVSYHTRPLRSPDGKLILRGFPERDRKAYSHVELADAKSGKSLAEFPKLGADLLAFTPDSKRIIGRDEDGTVYSWDAAKVGEPLKVSKLNSYGAIVGRLPMRLADTWAAVPEPNEPWKNRPNRIWSISRVAYEPFDRGKTWTGRGWLADFHVTRDGGIVGWAKFDVPDHRLNPAKRSLFIIDPGVDAPREYPLEPGTGFAVSPDGRTAVFGVGSGDIAVYELLTGQRRHTFTGLTRVANSLAFSPDGRLLASSSPDGPVLLWDVRGDLTKPAKPDAAGWGRAWEALGGEDAAKAFQAIRLFALYPDDGVSELKNRFAEVRSPAATLCERAVEAMQLANTESAKKLLAEWAKGPAEDALTKAAKASSVAPAARR